MTKQGHIEDQRLRRCTVEPGPRLGRDTTSLPSTVRPSKGAMDSSSQLSTSSALYSASPAAQEESHDARYALGRKTDVDSGRDPERRATARNDTELMGKPMPPSTRRTQRTDTFRTVEHFDGLQVRPGWRPGAEPGVDPAKPDGGHASIPSLSAPCDITVVDFCQGDLAIQRLDNDTLDQFLKLPPPKWSICRWISVNGLSWDVIKVLGQRKNLHKLAIEDIMNTRSRTKAEW